MGAIPSAHPVRGASRIQHRADREGGVSEVEYPTPTFQKFPTLQNFQLRLHKGNEIWLLKSMEIVVHSKKSLFQQKFQKNLCNFNRNSQFKSVMQKNEPIGLPESVFFVRLRFPVLLGIRHRNPGCNST